MSENNVRSLTHHDSLPGVILPYAPQDATLSLAKIFLLHFFILCAVGHSTLTKKIESTLIIVFIQASCSWSEQTPIKKQCYLMSLSQAAEEISSHSSRWLMWTNKILDWSIRMFPFTSPIINETFKIDWVTQQRIVKISLIFMFHRKKLSNNENVNFTLRSY